MKKQLINLQPVKERIREKLLEKYDSTLYMNTSTIRVELDIKEMLEEYITEQQVAEPEIYITPDAYIKMRKLVDDNTTEIGWYGTVTQMPGLNAFVIDDILVYPQTVTGTTCEQDDDRIRVVITPPTGLVTYIIRYSVITLGALIVIGGVVLFIKKRVLRN